MKIPTLLILLFLLTLQYRATAAKLQADDGAFFDTFGRSVSLSGSIGLVGAVSDDDGVGSADEGSAYVFRALDTATGTVTQHAKLTASDGAASDYLGVSASLSGSIGLVGAYLDAIGGNPPQGSAYVFRNLDTVTGVVTQNAKLIASDGAANDYFGASVSLSGSIGLVGSYNDDIGANTDQGSAYVFRALNTATGTVTQNVKLTASDGAAGDYFGVSVSQSGSIGLVGASGDNVGANGDQGSAYVFRALNTATGTVTQQAKLIASDGAASDGFGASVSLSGSIGLVGAYEEAYVFRGLDTATGTVTQNVKLVATDGTGGDRFGISVSLSGSVGLVGAENDTFGNFAGAGSAYLFRNLDVASGAMTQNVKITASGSSLRFGGSVSVDGDDFIIGAYGNTVDNVPAAGQAYSGNIGSITTLDAGQATKTISGISFISEEDWVVGQATDFNQVTLSMGDSADVTKSGRAVHIGQNAGSDNNTLIIAGTLTANQINVGAAGNTGNILQVGTGGTSGSLSTSSVIANHGRVIFNRSDAISQGTAFGSNAITGSGSLTQAGAGTLTLTTNNTYTGGTTVSAGVLKNGVANALSTSGTLTVQNTGTYDINGHNQTVGALADGGTSTGVVTNSGAAASLTVSNAANANFSGTIRGAGLALIKQASGTLTLGGSNSYGGGTTVGSGTLVAAHNAALGSGGVLMTNGTVLASAGTTIANNFTIGTLIAPAVTNAYASVSVAGWDFSTNAGGVGNFGPSPMDPTASATGLNIGGLTRGPGVATSTFGSGAANAWGGSGFDATSSAAAITAGDFATFTVSILDGYALNLTNISAYNVRRSATGPTNGVWQWSTNGTSFSNIGSAITWGATTTSSGNAQPAVALNAVSPLQALGAGATVTFRLVNYNASGAGGTWYLNDPNDTTAIDFALGGQIATVAPATYAGTGTLGLGQAGEATFTGNVLVNSTATLTATNGAKAIFSGVISGPGTNITKTGAGTVTLSGASANTFAGRTTVSEGTLQLSKSANTAALAGNVTVNIGATLLISTSGQVADSSAVTLSGGTIALSGGASETFGNLDLTTASFLDFDGGTGVNMTFGTYTPTSLLTVSNFVGFSTLRFRGDLTGAINNASLFAFGNGFGSAVYDANSNIFTITAIPEPSTILVAAGLAALLLWPVLRRRALKARA
jgi:autotransporter-associated beta strand protein